MIDTAKVDSIIVYNEDGVSFRGTWESIAGSNPKFTLSSGNKFDSDYVYVYYPYKDEISGSTDMVIAKVSVVKDVSTYFYLNSTLNSMVEGLSNPDEIEIVESDKDSVVLDWSQEVDDEDDIDYYDVYRDDKGKVASKLKEKYFEDTNLTANEYTYTIIAHDIDGNKTSVEGTSQITIKRTEDGNGFAEF